MQMRWKKIGIFVGACVAIGAVVLSRTVGKPVPEHTRSDTELQQHTTVQTEQVQTQTYDSSFFLSLVQDACGDALPLTNLSIEIQENETITASGILQKKQAEKLLRQQSDSISQSYTAVLQFLPEELPVSFQLQVGTAGGKATLTLRQLSVASMELPSSWMQDDLLEPLERDLNTELGKQFASISSVASQDGGLLISGESK